MRYGLDRVRFCFFPLFSILRSSVSFTRLTYFAFQGFIVIPKSVKQARIVANADVFDFTLEQEDIDHLTSLDEFLITVSRTIPQCGSVLILALNRTGK